MDVRVITAVFLIASVCGIPAAAQGFLPSSHPRTEDFEPVVLPITDVKPGLKFGPDIEARFGTGFCLDPDCRFVGTNYHVAVTARPRKIKGQEIVQRYLATGPDDDGATTNEIYSGSPMKYNLSRDLAILQLRHPLGGHHGISFLNNDLRIGQEVEIYAYPRESAIHPRALLQFHGRFKGESASGLLAFWPSTTTRRMAERFVRARVVESWSIETLRKS